MRNFFEFTGNLGEERTIEETFVLTSEDAGQVPKTITRDGTEYVLEEDSIKLQVSKKELWRDQQVMEEYVTYAVEDNDIDRLQREITKDGRVLELIGVEYSVTEATESGLPLAYAAKCRYAVNVDRDREVPVEWKATAVYTGTVEEVSEETEAAAEEHASGTGSEAEEIPGAFEAAESGTEELWSEREAFEQAERQGERNALGQEDSREEDVPEETETFGEETVPLAAAIEEAAVPLNGVTAGIAGTVFLSMAAVYTLLLRRRNQVAVYMKNGRNGKRETFIGRACAREEKGLWIISIPEKLLKLPGIHAEKLVLKPPRKLLQGKIKKAKVVSPRGFFMADIQDTMPLWEKQNPELGMCEESLAASAH